MPAGGRALAGGLWPGGAWGEMSLIGWHPANVDGTDIPFAPLSIDEMHSSCDLNGIDAPKSLPFGKRRRPS